MPWYNLIWYGYYQHKVPHGTREVGSFWWKDILRLNVLYRGIVRCTLRDGSTVLFWNDLWSDGIMSIEYPRLFSFAINQHILVKQIMEVDELDMLFNLPLSEQAYEELERMQSYLHAVPYDISSKDI